jgi:hypothetical protein
MFKESKPLILINESVSNYGNSSSSFQRRISRKKSFYFDDINENLLQTPSQQRRESINRKSTQFTFTSPHRQSQVTSNSVQAYLNRLRKSRSQSISTLGLNRSRKTTTHRLSKFRLTEDCDDNEDDDDDACLEEVKFGSSLSKDGQCAMLKTYEDELCKRLKEHFPREYLPRIKTAMFKLNTKHYYNDNSSQERSSSPTSSICTLSDMSEQKRRLKVSKQIRSAMEIIDDLGKLTNDNDGTEVIIKYEKWYNQWSKMFNNNKFFQN